MSVLPTPGTARRRILTPYVMLWIAAASFALAYLALLGLRPHMFASAAHNTAEIEQKLAQTKRDMERGLADLDPLRRTVGEVKMDVANLKIAAQEASARDQVLLDKVTALESATPKMAEKAPSARSASASPAAIPPTPTPNPKKVAGAGTFMPPVGSAEDMRARATQSATVINGAQKQSIETGSIERTAAVPPAEKPKAPAKPQAQAKPQPVGVILATGPSVDSLRLNWSILTDRHPDAVRNLKPRYVVTGKASERTYGLIAGPVASKDDAMSLCRVMAERGQTCTVGIYRGNAL